MREVLNVFEIALFELNIQNLALVLVHEAVDTRSEKRVVFKDSKSIVGEEIRFMRVNLMIVINHSVASEILVVE